MLKFFIGLLCCLLFVSCADIQEEYKALYKVKPVIENIEGKQ